LGEAHVDGISPRAAAPEALRLLRIAQHKIGGNDHRARGVRAMKTKLVIMRPGQAPHSPGETCEVDLPARPRYHELVALVRPLLDDGLPEHVLVYTGSLPHLGERFYRDMFVDGEGHALLLRLAKDGVTVRDGRAKACRAMRRRPRLYRRNVLMHEAPSDPESHLWIAGPAVFFPNRRVWF
jgi:hypothetical protein